MTLKKSRRTSKQEPLVVVNPSNFPNPNIEKFFLELQGKTFIQDKGFEPSMILCNEI